MLSRLASNRYRRRVEGGIDVSTTSAQRNVRGAKSNVARCFPDGQVQRASGLVSFGSGATVKSSVSVQTSVTRRKYMLSIHARDHPRRRQGNHYNLALSHNFSLSSVRAHLESAQTGDASKRRGAGKRQAIARARLRAGRVSQPENDSGACGHASCAETHD